MAKSQSGVASGTEGLTCFVCDVGVVGRYYLLANCRTQTSKVRLIEKLGHLVGDDYLVVISQEDIICRGCAMMINSLDKLEKELGSLRSMVLRYLEKKYDLQDGELVNTRAHVNPVKVKEKSEVLPDFQTRKRKALSGEVDSEHLKDTKDVTWLQCDKCKYTTHYDSYMTHHVRNHPKEKTPPATPQVVPEKQNGNDKEENEVQEKNTAETVEMIAAEIGQDFADETIAEQQIFGGETKQMTLQSVENEDGVNTLCMVDENGIIVQKVEQADDGTLYVQMPDNSDPTKQMLSVTDDGSVQMVEVLWDDMVNQDDSQGPSMVAFE